MNSSELRPVPLRYRPTAEKKSALAFFSLFVFGFLIAVLGLFAGFMYGDAYGRKHAQYDNPVLREYYAGQCYAYWETQFKKTVRQALTKIGPQAEHTARLDEMRMMLMDMQHNISELALQKDAATKKKVVSAGSGIGSGQGLSSRLP